MNKMVNIVTMNRYVFLLIFILMSHALISCSQNASKIKQDPSDENDKISVGAWYFGGWSFPPDADGHTFHISPTLTREYRDREPIWGWREDKPGVMEQQINYAAKAGLDFWGFCWYDNSLMNTQDKALMDHLNDALNLFIESNNSKLLDFFLLSVQPVSKSNWEGVSDRIIAYFDKPNYLRINGKPIVIFFNAEDVIDSLGGNEETNLALNSFRTRASSKGYNSVLIGARTFPRPENPIYQNKFIESGFDFLTTYNNADDGRKNSGSNPYSALLEGDQKSWNEISDNSSLPFLPVVGAGYDMRPWAKDHPTIPASDYWYTGVTPQAIADHLSEGIRWVKNHPSKTLQNMLIIYAWNENGEGAWLTPTNAEGTERLDKIRDVIENKTK